MRIGVAKEIKSDEYRVALTPAGALELINAGHEVAVETEAGVGSAFPDEAYTRVGATIESVDDVWERSDLVLKVKEPIPSEYARLRDGQILFTYLHIAADEPLTRALIDSGVTAVAYETVELRGGLPLLAPMSEVAGRLMRHLEEVLSGRVTLLMSSSLQIAASVEDADLVIGAVLVPGALAPKLVTREMIAGMKSGAVVVDVAIDQGGCFETSRATTHADPVYVVDDVTHYCVANMPGGVPVTSTRALTNATLPYVEAIARHGLRHAVAADPALAKGVNVIEGKVTYEAVAEAHGLDYTPLEAVLPLSAV